MVTLDCAQCGDPFQASRRTARFCSDKCRKQSFRRAEPGKFRRDAATGLPEVAEKAPAPVDLSAMEKSVCHTTLDALEDCGRVNTPLGQLALRLALRLDIGMNAGDSGSSLAALSKELRATLAAATANAATSGDFIDELRARREAKRRGA